MTEHNHTEAEYVADGPAYQVGDKVVNLGTGRVYTVRKVSKLSVLRGCR